jgi:hypothetical protein
MMNELEGMLSLQFEMNNTLIEVEKHKQPPTDSNLPLLVLCINASRLGTDVNQALLNISRKYYIWRMKMCLFYIPPRSNYFIKVASWQELTSANLPSKCDPKNNYVSNKYAGTVRVLYRLLNSNINVLFLLLSASYGNFSSWYIR